MKTITSLLFFLVLSSCAFGQAKKDVKMFYWEKDCKICDQITSDGVTYFIFNTPDFSLAVSGFEGKKVLFTEVYLVNKSSDLKNRIEFNPNDARIAVFLKKEDKTPVELSPLSPEQAADKMDGSSNAKVKNFFNRLGAGMANRTATVNSSTNGNVTIMDSQGISTGVYQGNTTSTVTVPDEEARNEAERKVTERNAKVEAKSRAILQTTLRANTVFPGKDIMGRIYFPYKKGVFMYVLVQIGDTAYIKGFGLSQK